LRFSAQTNDVAPCANDVLRNDVMLCINKLALCANGKMRQFKPKRKTLINRFFFTNPAGGAKNRQVSACRFFICAVGTTSFDLRSTSFRAWREHHCRFRHKQTMLHLVQMMCFATM